MQEVICICVGEALPQFPLDIDIYLKYPDGTAYCLFPAGYRTCSGWLKNQIVEDVLENSHFAVLFIGGKK